MIHTYIQRDHAICICDATTGHAVTAVAFCRDAHLELLNRVRLECLLARVRDMLGVTS